MRDDKEAMERKSIMLHGGEKHVVSGHAVYEYRIMSLMM